MTQQTAITSPRTEIDRIDREILKLLNERARIALAVGEAKTNVDTSLCDPTREREVIARLCDSNQGPFPDESITDIFQRIIDESLRLQQHTFAAEKRREASTSNALVRPGSRVAFLGERGTFSEEAVLTILADECTTISFPTIDEVFSSIERDAADYILTPIENTLVGSLHRNYVLLMGSGLSIVGEVVLPVSHHLISNPDSSLRTIRIVESHPAALGQCEHFFAAHPHLQRVEADDTAGSVRRAVESNDITHAAIGSRRAAEIYGGNILLEHIEDQAQNFTRFALLAREPGDSQGDKISMVLRLVNRPGSLHNALRPLVRRGIDLYKIESMPIRDAPGQFHFYLDMGAPANEGELPAALNEIRRDAEEVRLLGRYRTVRAGVHERRENH